MCDMEYDIMRMTARCLPQISLPCFHPVADIQRAVVCANIFLAAEFRKQNRALAAPKIQPARPEQEMHALNVLRRMHDAVPRAANHELNAVKPMLPHDGRNGPRIVFENFLHVAVRIGEIC